MKFKIILLLLSLWGVTLGKVTQFQLTTSKTNVALESSVILQAKVVSNAGDELKAPMLPESDSYVVIGKDTRKSTSSSDSYVE